MVAIIDYDAGNIKSVEKAILYQPAHDAGSIHVALCSKGSTACR